MPNQDPPTLGDVVRAIGGDDPPQSLRSGIKALASSLARTIGDGVTLPVRAELRKRLVAVAAAARLIEREISDRVILSLLLVDDQRWTEDENATVRGLQDIESRSLLAAAKVPKGKGRQMHYPRRGGAAPMTQCALIISVAWRVARKKWPGMDDGEAKHACEMLWRFASRDGRRQSIEVWRDHLRNAKVFRGKPEAEMILKALTGG